MKKIIAILLAVLMLAATALAGTAMAAEKEDFIGEWHIKSMKQGAIEMDASLLAAMGQSATLTLNEDGTATLTMNEQSQEGTWAADGSEGTVLFGAENVITLEDGLLTVGNEEAGTVMVFSKEAAEAVDLTLGEAIEDAQLSDFDGKWNAIVYVAFGTPLPLSIMGADISITIGDGKVAVFEKVTDLETGEITDTMEKEFSAEIQEGGKLYVDFGGDNILEKIGMEASGISLTLHEGGRLSGTTPEIEEAVNTLRILSEGTENTSAEEAEGTEDGEAGESDDYSLDTYIILEKAE